MNTTIKEQILAVRDTGETNMFDVNMVQVIANREGFYELVVYLEDHRREYSRFIMTGETDEEEEAHEYTDIDVKPLRDSWYEGTIGDCRFQAKVYDTGSKFGINKGRVSKLEVWDRIAGLPMRHMSYDRGWNIKPSSDEHWELLWDLLECLEALPISEG